MPFAPHRRALRLLVRAGFLSVVVAGGAWAEDAEGEGRLAAPAESVVRGLEIRPAAIDLGGANREQQVQVTASDGDGRVWDVTDRCEVSFAASGLARHRDGVLRGVANGRTEVVVRYGGVEARVPLRVAGMETYPPVHFVNDILPLFSKLRCNSSGCHGKASGQNGFKLSVFGFDPHSDYSALVKEARGRRLFPAVPAQSLLFLKTTGLMPHGGGRRAASGSADAERILQWIAQGAPWGTSDAPTLESIEVEPVERIMRMRAGQQILVTALYSDGARRDVTRAATYSSNAGQVAEVDPRGRVRIGERPGEAAVTVNYMGQVAAVRVIVPRPAADRAETAPLPVHNRIDELVWARLAKLGVTPSAVTDDATFLRRLYLDTLGTLPTPAEVREFLDDARTDKRQRAVDRVLEREEYADYWTLKWCDLLLVNSEQLGARGAFEWHRWLRRQVAADRPYDEWVRDVITATGHSARQGPVNFYRGLRTPPDVAKTVSQVFLGIRLDCAQCHHHPFEIWGQEDFYGLAGYFTNIQRKSLGGDRELIYHAGHQPARMPRTDERVPTRPLGEAPVELGEGDPRQHLAAWLTSPDNPWFARLVANRLWKHYLGRGLVEPEDDLRSTNPPTNAPLLDYLAEQVVRHDFRLKRVTRQILNSRVFQLSSEVNGSNADDDQNFSRYTVKRMPAEVLLDAISAVTGSPEPFAGMAPGTRAVQLWDNRLPSYFLDTFGRSERESPCECAKSNDPTMAQALHLMNAPEINAKIEDPQGRIAGLVEHGASPSEVIEQLCLAALGRPPQAREQEVAESLFADQPLRQAAEDYMWTLLNSYEFLFID